MTDYSGQLGKLLLLRAKVDAALQAEADRQGIDLTADDVQAYADLVKPSKGRVGYVVFPSPDLAHAAAQIAAAAERWAGRGDG